MHKCNTFSSTSTKFNPYFGKQHYDAKVGIKSCRGARECVSFVHACICSYPAAILYLSRHMQYTMNAIWVVSVSKSS